MKTNVTLTAPQHEKGIKLLGSLSVLQVITRPQGEVPQLLLGGHGQGTPFIIFDGLGAENMGDHLPEGQHLTWAVIDMPSNVPDHLEVRHEDSLASVLERGPGPHDRQQGQMNTVN